MFCDSDADYKVKSIGQTIKLFDIHYTYCWSSDFFRLFSLSLMLLLKEVKLYMKSQISTDTTACWSSCSGCLESPAEPGMPEPFPEPVETKLVVNWKASEVAARVPFWSTSLKGQCWSAEVQREWRRVACFFISRLHFIHLWHPPVLTRLPFYFAKKFKDSL